jgi:hypothetical protein
LYIHGNETDRNNIITDLYGDPDPELRRMFDQRLGVSQKMQEFVYEARQHLSERSLQLLERVLILERKAHQVFTEDLREDYVDEKKKL